MPIYSCKNCLSFFAPLKCSSCGQIDNCYCLSCHNRNHQYDMKFHYLGRYDKEQE